MTTSAPSSSEEARRARSLGLCALAFVFVTPLGIALLGRYIYKVERRVPWEMITVAALYVAAFLWLELSPEWFSH